MSTGLKTTLISKVRSWLATASGIPIASIIPAQDNGPREALPYLTVQITSLRESGTAKEHKWIDDETGAPMRAIRTHYASTVLISGYGADATDYVVEAKNKTNDRELSRPVSIAVTALGDVRDMTAVRGAAFEGQAQLELTVGFVIESAAQVYAHAEHLHADVKLEYAEGSEEFNFDLDLEED